MAKKLGNVRLPQNLEEVIEKKSNADTSFKEEEKFLGKSSSSEREKNPQSFLNRFDRLIDPVILSLFFGLYKSRELPPEDDEPSFDLEGSYEFGVDISRYKEIFNNLLLYLWVYENGFPTEPKNLMEYRQKLYDFTQKILEDDYFRKVIIPFYTKKADESESGRSFLARLKDSEFVEYEKEKMSMATPEFIFKEFTTRQKEFSDEIIKPLSEKAKNL